MKPLARNPVNKYKSAKTFKAKARTTKAPNVAPPPMRGGIRF